MVMEQKRATGGREKGEAILDKVVWAASLSRKCVVCRGLSLCKGPEVEPRLVCLSTVATRWPV